MLGEMFAWLVLSRAGASINSQSLTIRACWSQGRVRTKTVKRASRVIIEKYYGRLTQDFDVNKRICAEVAIIQSKRLRNKIAGFTTVSLGHTPIRLPNSRTAEANMGLIPSRSI
jgi:ribosomal protein S17E